MAIKPEPARSPRRFGKQRAALVETNCIHAERRQLGYFSDLHFAGMWLGNLGHGERIHSGAESRVKAFFSEETRVLAPGRRSAHRPLRNSRGAPQLRGFRFRPRPVFQKTNK